MIGTGSVLHVPNVFLHDDLPAQAFLGGRSVYHDFVRPVARKLADTQRRADRGRALHVMAAAMSHGESVVFCQQAEGGAARTLFVNGAEGGFHAADAVLDLEAVLCERVLQKLTGLKFLTADFRQVKDTVRQLFQLRADLIDIFSDFFFHVNFPS